MLVTRRQGVLCTGCLERRYGVFRSTPDGSPARPSFLHDPSLSNRRRELGCWWAMCRPLSRQRVASDRRSAVKLGRSFSHSFSFPPRHDGPGVSPPPRAKLAVLGIIHTFQVPGLLVLHIPQAFLAAGSRRSHTASCCPPGLAYSIPHLRLCWHFSFFSHTSPWIAVLGTGHPAVRPHRPPIDRPAYKSPREPWYRTLCDLNLIWTDSVSCSINLASSRHWSRIRRRGRATRP